MAHLSPQTQQRFLGRAMDPQEVLTVTLHLRECASCRERLTVLRSGVTGSLVEQILAEAPIEDHPSQDLLAAFVDNDLAQADRTVVENHLATCEICPGIVTDLQSFREELRELTTKEYTPFRENRTWPSQKAPGWTNWNFTQLMAFGATVATAALLILLVFVPIKFSSLPQFASRTPGNGSVGQFTVADHDHEIQFSFNGMIKPVPVLPQAELDALNGLCIDALRNQPLEAAPALAALRGSLSVWRGQSSGAARMKAIRPVRTVIESGRTTFRWTPVLGAKSYTVHVVDDQTQEETATSPAIFPSTNASVCEWSGVPSLTRGKRYRWYVAAAIEEQEIDAPGNEEAPARFSVLSEADLVHLNELKHASHNDRLIGALLDLRVGLLDDAEDDFRSLSDEPSQTPNGKAFLSRLIEGIEHLKE